MNDGELNRLIDNLHQAQKNNNTALQIDALLKLAQYHYNNDNFEKAKLILEEILQFDSNYENINYYLALIALQNEQYSLAKKYLVNELKINPKNKSAKELEEKLQIHSNFPFITITLLILNSIVFFFTFPEISLVQSIKFALNYNYFSYASLVSSLFFHVNLLHFSLNMFILLMFGLILEKTVGSLKFLIIYLVSGIAGNFVESFFVQNGFVLGASAALFGLLGAILMREPLLEMKIFGFVKVPIIIVFGAFFAINSLVENYFRNLFLSTAIYFGDIAHIIGLMVGFLLTGIFYRETIDIFYNWLLIFGGFWVIKYSLENFIKIIHFFSFYELFYVLFLFIIGVFMIAYSYNVLKLKEGIDIGK